jgi:predicted membrane channel-forming protein YqfA (hemolysin III family)
MANKFNKKFSWVELSSNSDGKQSGSGFLGLILGLIGGGCFISGVVAYFMKIPEAINLLEQTIILIGASAALLGARKFAAQRKNNSNIIDIDKQEKG